ncbi:MAG TPA: hypothetical protein V6C58_13410, partial [Allocoleopsis sp.]
MSNFDTNLCSKKIYDPLFVGLSRRSRLFGFVVLVLQLLFITDLQAQFCSSCCSNYSLTASSNSPLCSSGGALNLSASGTGPGDNLVTNGNFTSGNTGFTTNYTNNASLSSSSGNSGNYRVTTLPTASGLLGAGCTSAASTGQGNVLIANGASSSGSNVWAQSISVTSGVTYYFEYKVASLSGSSPAQLRVNLGTTIINTTTLGTTACTWQTISGTITPTSTGSLTLSIVDLNTSTTSNRNDFIIDDIYFGVSSGVNLASLSGGTWSWTGPNGF